MGNWRRVWIKLHIPLEYVESLRKFVNKNWNANWNKDIEDENDSMVEEKIPIKWNNDAKFNNFKYGCASTGKNQEMDKEMDVIHETPDIYYFRSSTGSICGINNWVSENMNITGNIGKDASNEEIMKEWLFIAAKFPQLEGEIHVCGDYESSKCIGKVRIENGAAYWEPPSVKKIKNDEFTQGFNLATLLMQNGSTRI